jgi:hypothetical protein
VCIELRSRAASKPRSQENFTRNDAVVAAVAGEIRYAKLNCFFSNYRRDMLVSKEYMGYLARQVTKKLIAGEFIETKDLNGTAERLNAAMLEEMQLEDRINDEVRLILDAYQEEMRTTGASYQEMFKKVKQQLVQKYKAVL